MTRRQRLDALINFLGGWKTVPTVFLASLAFLFLLAIPIGLA